jgi:hypothetical protein
LLSTTKYPPNQRSAAIFCVSSLARPATGSFDFAWFAVCSRLPALGGFSPFWNRRVRVRYMFTLDWQFSKIKELVLNFIYLFNFLKKIIIIIIFFPSPVLWF